MCLTWEGLEGRVVSVSRGNYTLLYEMDGNVAGMRVNACTGQVREHRWHEGEARQGE